jgi:hypothetical protein
MGITVQVALHVSTEGHRHFKDLVASALYSRLYGGSSLCTFIRSRILYEFLTYAHPRAWSCHRSTPRF